MNSKTSIALGVVAIVAALALLFASGAVVGDPYAYAYYGGYYGGYYPHWFHPWWHPGFHPWWHHYWWR
ncbi:MAG: hypothetical protein WAM14_07780 [Candidatus Nitrosopolaris sp.]